MNMYNKNTEDLDDFYTFMKSVSTQKYKNCHEENARV